MVVLWKVAERVGSNPRALAMPSLALTALKRALREDEAAAEPEAREGLQA